MPISVPTIDEFNALSDRVTKLEQGQPTPPNPDPGTGVQAKRIADCIELFGVNTFSSDKPDANLWGSWPADYSPPSVIAALRYMTEGSGFAFRLREYHYAGRENMQRPWLSEIVAAIPGTRVAICPGANATQADVPSMFSLANDPACGIAWIEGLNEPNTDFGSGEVPVETTKAIQDAVWGGRASHAALGPSIVAGMPHPEGWITGYCGDSMDAINAAMDDGNGHYYPPGCPDLPNSGTSTEAYVSGLGLAYQHAIHLTEFHPTLYNSEGNKPDQPGWSGERDAFYTLLTLLRCGKLGVPGLWWYALFDYGTAYVCGLFPKSGNDAPRPAATALRNLCTICADPFEDARTFAPGKLDVVIEGLPPDAAWDLYQASDGRFILPIWRAAKEPAGAAVPVLVAFGSPVTLVAEFNPLADAAAGKQAAAATEYTLALPPGVRLLVIDGQL